MKLSSFALASAVLGALVLAPLLGFLLASFPADLPSFNPDLTRLHDRLVPPLTRPSSPDVTPGPFGLFLLGTDSVGRDVFLRSVQGTGVAILVGVATVLVSMVFGVLAGSLAGYYGDRLLPRGLAPRWLRRELRLDRLVTGLADVFLCFPVLFLYLAAAAIFSPSIWVIVLVVGSTSWMKMARIIRAEVSAGLSKGFVRYAVLCNSPGWRVLVRHLLPHAVAPMAVSATLGVAQVVLLESTLSFLGVGPAAAELASLGNIISEGRDYVTTAPWLVVVPGTLIATIVVSLNTIAERLQKRFDRERAYPAAV